MTRADLDAIEATYSRAVDPKINRDRYALAVGKLLEAMPALVAELRAARAVVEAAQEVAPQGHADYWAELDRALRAYDRAVSEP